MNIPSVIILIVVLALLFFAVRYSLKNKSCGDCRSCGKDCSRRKN